jgi:hypothetical protein
MSRAIYVLPICVSYGMLWGNLYFTFQTNVNLKDTLSSQSMVTQKTVGGSRDAKGKN